MSLPPWRRNGVSLPRRGVAGALSTIPLARKLCSFTEYVGSCRPHSPRTGVRRFRFPRRVLANPPLFFCRSSSVIYSAQSADPLVRRFVSPLPMSYKNT